MPQNRFRCLTVLALTAGYYFLLLTFLGRSPEGLFAPSQHGFIFNSMALNMLEGRFDVDPSTTRGEGFLLEGRTYAYFGIFPALLRLPLVFFVDLSSIHLEVYYRFAAMIFAAAGGIYLARQISILQSNKHDIPARLFAYAVLLSGPSIMIGPRSEIFNEVTLWSWSLALWFLAILLPAFDASRPPSTGRLTTLAIVVGCAMLTRVSTGMSLALALALFMLTLVWRDAGGSLVRLPVVAWRWRIIAPTLTVVAFVTLTGAVNYARWGNPLTAADLRLQQEMLVLFPDRLARLDTYGLFDVRRFGLGLLYYFAPIWVITRDGRFLFHDDIARLFDAFELPPTSFFLTDPFTLVLAGIGLVSLLRQRVPGAQRGPALAVMAGLSLAPTLMLVAWYMAFRYRVEFMPLFLLAACFGVIKLGQSMNDYSVTLRNFISITLIVIFSLQLLSAHIHAILYLISPYGPSLGLASGGLWEFYARPLFSR